MGQWIRECFAILDQPILDQQPFRSVHMLTQAEGESRFRYLGEEKYLRYLCLVNHHFVLIAQRGQTVQLNRFETKNKSLENLSGLVLGKQGDVYQSRIS